MIVVNEKLLRLFAERRIYHRPKTGGRWAVGDQLLVAADCELEPYSAFHFGMILPRRMGAFSYANCQFALPATRVGRYCSIGQRILWVAPEHPTAWASTSPFSYDPRGLQGVVGYLRDQAISRYQILEFAGGKGQGVTIGNDVWIGDEAAIREGVVVGDGAVVGARAVVTKDVPPYAVVVGAPARVVRMRFPDPLIERFLALKWWRYGPEVIQALDVREPAAFLDRLEAAIGEGARELLLTPVTEAEIRATQA